MSAGAAAAAALASADSGGGGGGDAAVVPAQVAEFLAVYGGLPDDVLGCIIAVQQPSSSSQQSSAQQTPASAASAGDVKSASPEPAAAAPAAACTIIAEHWPGFVMLPSCIVDPTSASAHTSGAALNSAQKHIWALHTQLSHARLHQHDMQRSGHDAPPTKAQFRSPSHALLVDAVHGALSKVVHRAGRMNEREREQVAVAAAAASAAAAAARVAESPAASSVDGSETPASSVAVTVATPGAESAQQPGPMQVMNGTEVAREASLLQSVRVIEHAVTLTQLAPFAASSSASEAAAAAAPAVAAAGSGVDEKKHAAAAEHPPRASPAMRAAGAAAPDTPSLQPIEMTDASRMSAPKIWPLSAVAEEGDDAAPDLKQAAPAAAAVPTAPLLWHVLCDPNASGLVCVVLTTAPAPLLPRLRVRATQLASGVSDAAAAAASAQRGPNDWYDVPRDPLRPQSTNHSSGIGGAAAASGGVAALVSNERAVDHELKNARQRRYAGLFETPDERAEMARHNADLNRLEVAEAGTQAVNGMRALKRAQDLAAYGDMVDVTDTWRHSARHASSAATQASSAAALITGDNSKVASAAAGLADADALSEPMKVTAYVFRAVDALLSGEGDGAARGKSGEPSLAQTLAHRGVGISALQIVLPGIVDRTLGVLDTSVPRHGLDKVRRAFVGRCVQILDWLTNERVGSHVSVAPLPSRDTWHRELVVHVAHAAALVRVLLTHNACSERDNETRADATLHEAQAAAAETERLRDLKEQADVLRAIAERAQKKLAPKSAQRMLGGAPVAPPLAGAGSGITAATGGSAIELLALYDEKNLDTFAGLNAAKAGAAKAAVNHVRTAVCDDVSWTGWQRAAEQLVLSLEAWVTATEGPHAGSRHGTVPYAQNVAVAVDSLNTDDAHYHRAAREQHRAARAAARDAALRQAVAVAWPAVAAAEAKEKEKHSAAHLIQRGDVKAGDMTWMEERDRNRQIERALDNANERFKQLNTMAIVGPDGAGKTTFIKQLIEIYGMGFPDATRATWVPLIHHNILLAAEVLVVEAMRLDVGAALAAAAAGGVAADDSVRHARDTVMRARPGLDALNDATANAIHVLWTRDSYIKRAWRQRAAHEHSAKGQQQPIRWGARHARAHAPPVLTTPLDDPLLDSVPYYFSRVLHLFDGATPEPESANTRKQLAPGDSNAYYEHSRMNDRQHARAQYVGADKRWLPSVDDVVRCRRPRVLGSDGYVGGVTEFDIMVDGNRFRIIDFGQHSVERRKYVHLLEGVTAFIFVLNVAEYDRVFVEGTGAHEQVVNKLGDAIRMLDTFVNSRWLRQSSCILFLNHADELRAKMARVAHSGVSPDPKEDGPDYGGYDDSSDTPHSSVVRGARNVYDAAKFKAHVSQYWPEFGAWDGSRYGSGRDMDNGYMHLLEYFQHLCQSTAREMRTGRGSGLLGGDYSYSRNIYTHITNMTHREHTHMVFNACKDIVIRQCLSASGLSDGGGGDAEYFTAPSRAPVVYRSSEHGDAADRSRAAPRSVAEGAWTPAVDVRPPAATPATPRSGDDERRADRRDKSADAVMGKQQPVSAGEMDPAVGIGSHGAPSMGSRAVREWWTANERWPPALHDTDNGDSDDDADLTPEQRLAKTRAVPWTNRTDPELKRVVSEELFSALQQRKRVKEQEKEAAERKRRAGRIDNVFADMENSFNGLSAASIYWERDWLLRWRSACARFITFLIAYLPLMLITYGLLIVASVTIVLPACFVLLVVRTAIVERKVENFAIRQLVLAAEPWTDKLWRVFRLAARALPMLFIVCGLPLVSIYYIIPQYGATDDVVFGCIGGHICLIVALQLAGTFRSLVSFRLKKEAAAEQKAQEAITSGVKYSAPNFTPFKWTLPANVIAVVSLLVETLQLAMFSLKALQPPPAEQETTTTTTTTTTTSDSSVGRFGNFLYLSFSQFFESHVHEVYGWVAIGLVGLLLLVFVVQFVRELRTFATLKKHGNTKDANELFFHSFVGSIIYGHGELKGVTPAISTIVGLLSDTLFMIICEKLLSIVVCSKVDSKAAPSYLQINPAVQCWTGDHQYLATVALVAFSVYLPLSAMIAPMLMEADAEAAQDATAKAKAELKRKADLKQGKLPKPVLNKQTGLPMTQAELDAEERAQKKDVTVVKPFLSIVTVSKCVMIVLATFFGRNAPQNVILSQLFVMLVLAAVTLRWSVVLHAPFELGREGLAEPCLPPAVNVWRTYIWVAGAVGALVAAVVYQWASDFKGDLRLALLFGALILTALPFWYWYRTWEKYNLHLWCAHGPALVLVDLPLVKFEPPTSDNAAPAYNVDGTPASPPPDTSDGGRYLAIAQANAAKRANAQQNAGDASAALTPRTQAETVVRRDYATGRYAVGVVDPTPQHPHSAVAGTAQLKLVTLSDGSQSYALVAAGEWSPSQAGAAAAGKPSAFSFTNVSTASSSPAAVAPTLMSTDGDGVPIPQASPGITARARLVPGGTAAIELTAFGHELGGGVPHHHASPVPAVHSTAAHDDHDGMPSQPLFGHAAVAPSPAEMAATPRRASQYELLMQQQAAQAQALLAQQQQSHAAAGAADAAAHHEQPYVYDPRASQGTLSSPFHYDPRAQGTMSSPGFHMPPSSPPQPLQALLPAGGSRTPTAGAAAAPALLAPATPSSSGAGAVAEPATPSSAATAHTPVAAYGSPQV